MSEQAVRKWTSNTDAFRRVCGSVIVCRDIELKIDMERVRVESTTKQYESATTGGNQIGRWTCASAGRCRVGQDTGDYASHCLSHSGKRRAGGFDPGGDVYE